MSTFDHYWYEMTLILLTLCKLLLISLMLYYSKVPLLMFVFPFMEVVGFTYNVYVRPITFEYIYLYIDFALYVIMSTFFVLFLSTLRLHEFQSIRFRLSSSFYAIYAVSYICIFSFVYQGDLISTLIYGEYLRQDLSKNYAVAWIFLQLLLLLPAYFLFRPNSFSLLFFVLCHASLLALFGARGLSVSFLLIYMLVHPIKFYTIIPVGAFISGILWVYSLSRDIGLGMNFIHEVFFRFDASWNFIYHLKLESFEKLDVVEHISRIVFGTVPKSFWPEKPEISARLLQGFLEGSLPMKYSATNFIDFYFFGPIIIIFIFMFLIITSLFFKILPRHLVIFFVVTNILNLDFLFEGFSGAKFQYICFYLIICFSISVLYSLLLSVNKSIIRCHIP